MRVRAESLAAGLQYNRVAAGYSSEIGANEGEERGRW